MSTAAKVTKASFGNDAAWDEFRQRHPERCQDEVGDGVQPMQKTQSDSDGGDNLEDWTLKSFLGKDFPPKEPLIEGLLYRRDNCMMTARRRHGKTTMALNEVLALTLPRPDFLGYRIPKARRVIAFLFEDDPRELQEKLELMKGSGDTKDRLHVFNKEDFLDANIVVDVTNEAFRNKVVDLCAGSGTLDLIVFDHLGMLVGADYNNSKKMHQLVTFIYQLNKRFGCAVQILAHPRKRNHEFETSLVDDPEQFFEETLGTSHGINSTGALWGLQRENETTYFVGGSQRYKGHQDAMSLQLGDDGWFVVDNDLALNFGLVVNTEKRKAAWRALTAPTFTFGEAHDAVKGHLASKNSFAQLWNDLRQRKLIVEAGEGRYRKASGFATLPDPV